MTQEEPEISMAGVMEGLVKAVSGSVISQNTMRGYLGLPPVKFIPGAYHIDGVTDVSVFRKQAEKRRAAGESSWVHLHKVDAACVKGCTLYFPKEGGEDGG